MNARKIIGFALWMTLLSPFFLPAPARAWEEDKLVSLHYFHIPRADFSNDQGQIGMDAVQAEAILPLVVNESTVFLTGLNYRGLYLNYQGVSFSDPTPEGLLTEKDLPTHLQVFDVILGAGVDWDENWGSLLVFYPGIHGDFHDLSDKSFYFAGLLLASYRASEDLTLSGGAYYDDSFGRPQLLPILGAQWRIDRRLTLEALLPQFFILAWEFSPRLSAGVKCSVEGSQYRLREKSPLRNVVCEYTQILAGPYIDFNLAGDLFLRLEGGFVFSRKFEFRDEDSSRKLFDGGVEDAGYAGAALFYRY